MRYNLNESTSTLVKKLSHLFVRAANAELKDSGIAHAYTPFLMHLWKQDGLMQRDLYKQIGIEQPTAVRTLDRMERDGFIQRKPSPTDRRATLIYLTAKGRESEEQVINAAKHINKLASHGLNSEDKKYFNNLLRTMISNLES